MILLASIIPPSNPIPDPPEPKVLAMIAAIIASIAILLFIGFVVFEFFMDLFGTPLDFAEPPPPGLIDPFPENKHLPLDADEILSRYTLLSPLDRCTILGDRTVVLCTWNPPPGGKISEPPLELILYVDDFPVPWTMQFGNNTWIANLELEPGRHRISASSALEADFYVQYPGHIETPKGWTVMHAHPDVDDPARCDDCHERIQKPDDLVHRGRGISLGAWKGVSSCRTCHADADLESIHQHPVEPLRDCRRCHTIHGTNASEKSLLKVPREKVVESLCSQCHEPPESR